MSEHPPATAHVPRSELFSLQPIGLGTDHVESLESYTCRLAFRHDIARRRLEQLVNHRGPTLYDDLSGPPRLDSPTEPAAQFAQRLAEMTHQPSVAALGLGRFAGRLATMKTLRKHRAWCSTCFAEDRASGVAAHLPLLWSLEGYHRCLRHGTVLETSCGACGKRSVLSNSWHRALDHCPWCDRDLANSTASFAQLTRRGLVEVDALFGRILGDFVADASASNNAIAAADVTRAVTSALERGIAHTAKDLLARVGLPPPTLSTLKSGRNRPSLVVLTRLAAAAGVSIYGMFVPQKWLQLKSPGLPRAAKTLPRIKQPPTFQDWSAIKREVIAVVESSESPSLGRLASRMGVDPAHLSCQLGELRDVVKARWRQAYVEQQERKVMELIDEIRPVREALLRAGKRPSVNGIAKAMGRPARTPSFMRAVKALNAAE